MRTTTSLFDLLEKLDAAKAHYTLNRHRPETVQVSVTLVGARVETDVLRDGHTEVSVFKGSEDVLDDNGLIDRML